MTGKAPGLDHTCRKLSKLSFYLYPKFFDKNLQSTKLEGTPKKLLLKLWIYLYLGSQDPVFCRYGLDEGNRSWFRVILLMETSEYNTYRLKFPFFHIYTSSYTAKWRNSRHCIFINKMAKICRNLNID